MAATIAAVLRGGAYTAAPTAIIPIVLQVDAGAATEAKPGRTVPAEAITACAAIATMPASSAIAGIGLGIHAPAPANGLSRRATRTGTIHALAAGATLPTPSAIFGIVREIDAGASTQGQARGTGDFATRAGPVDRLTLDRLAGHGTARRGRTIGQAGTAMRSAAMAVPYGQQGWHPGGVVPCIRQVRTVWWESASPRRG